MRYNEADILAFREAVKQLNLTCPIELFEWPADKLCSICNGFGGAGMGTTGILTSIYRLYQASGAIHDLGYYIGGPGQRAAYDSTFLCNMKREWANAWGWFRYLRPLALAEQAKIRAAYVAVRFSGATYYNETGIYT